MFPAGDRVVYSALGRLYVKDLPAGTPRRLSAAASRLEYFPSVSRDGQRVVIIQANAIEGVAANQVIADLKTKLEGAGIDGSVKWKFRGGDEESREAGAFFATAMVVALFRMGVILLWQFNSFWGVICTLFAVILSTVGVLLGIQVNLLGTFNYISIIMAGTGVVALAGVIVGHNIVLVDTYYQLKRAGEAAANAALRAAVMRFRPVLLTTLMNVQRHGLLMPFILIRQKSLLFAYIAAGVFHTARTTALR